MLNLTYSRENVESQLRQNVLDLVGAFSNYDFFSEQERTEHLHRDYVAKIAGIASHLEALSRQDETLKGVKVLERFFRKYSKFDDFDTRYSSEYTSRWNQPIDTQSKLNQKIIDLQEKLGIDDSPYSGFILLNAMKYLAGKDSDNFVLRKKETTAKTLEELASELQNDFDIIDLPYNPNIQGNPYYKSDEARIRLTRKDFEIYFLGELRKKTIEDISKEEQIEGNINEVYELLSKRINNSLKKYDSQTSQISDQNLELFLQKCGSSAVEGLLFNHLFNKCKRTKTDFNANKKINRLFYKQKTLFARNLSCDGDGDYRFYSASGVSVNGVLSCDGEGDYRFGHASGVSVNGSLSCDGDGGGRFYSASGVSVNGVLSCDGDGVRRFYCASVLVLTEV